MAKTTSYEISKKLAEIGFKEENDWFWCGRYLRCGDLQTEIFTEEMIKYENEGTNYQWLKHSRSYDFETILEALPKQGLYMEFGLTGNQFLIKLCQFMVLHRKGESLADTAGRLLILLHEKELVKFEAKK